MIVYLLRHGETNWNIEQRMQGCTDIPLNDTGRRQAEISAEGLSKIPFSLCITSHLSRAYETAGLILQNHPDFLKNRAVFLARCGCRERYEATAKPFGVPILIDRRLREVELGEWEGKIGSGPNQEIPGEGFKAYWKDLDGENLPKSVECANKAADRAHEFITDIFSRPELQNETILMVSHGGFISRLLWDLNGRTEIEGRKVPMNLEAVRLECDEDGKPVFRGMEMFCPPGLLEDY